MPQVIEIYIHKLRSAAHGTQAGASAGEWDWNLGTGCLQSHLPMLLDLVFTNFVYIYRLAWLLVSLDSLAEHCLNSLLVKSFA